MLVRQLMADLTIPSHYASADEPMLRDRTRVEQQWDLARLQLNPRPGAREALLVLDEVQKVTHWSEAIKRLWDEDSAARRPLKVVLLESAPLLIQKGLTESLAGRCEIIPATHWSYDGDACCLRVTPGTVYLLRWVSRRCRIDCG